MRLYFLRHAEALDGMDDDARPLSPRGRQQARELGRFLARAGVVFDAAYSSPLVRAVQTAEIVLGAGEGLKPAALEPVEVLGLGATQRQWEGWLRCLPEAKHVLLVGHAPSLPARVRHLLSIAEEAALRLPKGAVACVETEDGGRSGLLKFFVSPKILGV